jgi:hypothetical protein
MIYIYLGFQSPQTSNVYGHFGVILIHLALLQHEQKLVKIQIAHIVGGGGTNKAKNILATAR